VKKPLRDTKYAQVVAHRYQCLRCFRTQHVKQLGILLYLLGLSYGAVSLALAALGDRLLISR